MTKCNLCFRGCPHGREAGTTSFRTGSFMAFTSRLPGIYISAACPCYYERTRHIQCDALNFIKGHSKSSPFGGLCLNSIILHRLDALIGRLSTYGFWKHIPFVLIIHGLACDRGTWIGMKLCTATLRSWHSFLSDEIDYIFPTNDQKLIWQLPILLCLIWTNNVRKLETASN